MSIFTDIRSLKHRPSGGLDIGNPRHVSDPDPTDWVYSYSYTDLINQRTDDVVKVTSVIPGTWSHAGSRTQIERYFLIRNGHKALALCRRTTQIESVSTNQSYVTGTDRALSQSLKSRAYPFKTRTSYDNYALYASDVFTPSLISLQDIRDLYHYRVDESNNHLEWIDKVTLQGWFPASVITTLDLAPPEHTGWDIEGSHITEIGQYIASGTVSDYTALHSSEVLESIMRMVSMSVLSDYKVTLDINLRSRMSVSMREFVYYDPKCGTIADIRTLPTETVDDEIPLIEGYMNEYVHELSRVLDREYLSEITHLSFYRCLNDAVYILFHTVTQPSPIGYVVCDFFKYLSVHYGFVDIPISTLLMKDHKT